MFLHSEISIFLRFEKFFDTEILNKLLSVIEVFDRFRCDMWTKNLEFTRNDNDLSVISRQFDTLSVYTLVSLWQLDKHYND